MYYSFISYLEFGIWVDALKPYHGNVLQFCMLSFGIETETLNSYHGDVLHNAKQLFSSWLSQQMTKCCVMRECENIHSWISLSADFAFSHQDIINGFKFVKRFLEIFSRDLTFFFSILVI